MWVNLLEYFQEYYCVKKDKSILRIARELINDGEKSEDILFEFIDIMEDYIIKQTKQ